MGIIPDAIINLVLMVAFGVYCVMGLSFFIMGIVYMGDAGAIGSTGIYLIFLGLLMLIIGGIALWANMNSNWMVLFIIELINVALFLVRMCARASHIRVRACKQRGQNGERPALFPLAPLHLSPLATIDVWAPGLTVLTAGALCSSCTS